MIMGRWSELLSWLPTFHVLLLFHFVPMREISGVLSPPVILFILVGVPSLRTFRFFSSVHVSTSVPRLSGG